MTILTSLIDSAILYVCIFKNEDKVRDLPPVAVHKRTEVNLQLSTIGMKIINKIES